MADPARNRRRRLSVFGEGRIGTNHNSILAGIKLYSGQAPTLMAKHRQDDPPIDKDLSAFVPSGGGGGSGGGDGGGGYGGGQSGGGG